MVDRVPEHPGRVRLIPVPGEDNLYDLVREDGATVEGTPLCKATMLPDDVCNTLGLNTKTAEPKDAIAKIAELAHIGFGTVKVVLKDALGRGYRGAVIKGLYKNITTDNSGTAVLGGVPGGTYTLSCDKTWVDASIPSVNCAVSGGITTTVNMLIASKNEKNATITTTQNIVFSPNILSIDVFCVGGGGGGGGYGAMYASSGGGGGGGYTETQLNITPTADTAYRATIGAGGAGSKSSDGQSIGGSAGGVTSFMTVSASGGGGSGTFLNNGCAPGGDGGSGGGASASKNYSAGSGGGDGSGGSGVTTSRGQGTTTRAFGEASGALYGGGGGGGGYASRPGGSGGTGGGGTGGSTGSGYSGSSGYGGGGGGGGSAYGNSGGYGGSGVVLIRWRNRV